MGEIVHFPKAVRTDKNEIDLFHDLSDLLGINLHQVIVEQNAEEIKKMQRKLQKDSLRIRSQFTK